MTLMSGMVVLMPMLAIGLQQPASAQFFDGTFSQVLNNAGFTDPSMTSSFSDPSSLSGTLLLPTAPGVPDATLIDPSSISDFTGGVLSPTSPSYDSGSSVPDLSATSNVSGGTDFSQFGDTQGLGPNLDGTINAFGGISVNQQGNGVMNGQSSQGGDTGNPLQAEQYNPSGPPLRPSGTQITAGSATTNDNGGNSSATTTETGATNSGNGTVPIQTICPY